MKRMKESTGLKILMALLFSVLAGVAVLMLCVQMVLSSMRWNSDGGDPVDALEQALVGNLLYQDLLAVGEEYYPLILAAEENKDPTLTDYYQRQIRAFENRFDTSETNFRFSILDAEGKQVMGNYNGEPALVWDNMTIDGTFATAEGDGTEVPETWMLYGYVLDLPVKDQYFDLVSQVRSLAGLQEIAMPVLVVSCVLCLVLFLMLMSGAGHRRGSEEIQLRFLERMPWDVFLCLGAAVWAAIIGGVVLVLDSVAWYYVRRPLEAAVYVTLGSTAVALMALVTLMSLAARLKVKGWWRNALIVRFVLWIWGGCRKGAGTVSGKVKEWSREKEGEEPDPEKPGLLARLREGCLRFFRWIGRGLKRLGQGMKKLLGRGGAAMQTLPLMWKSVLFVAAVVIVELICMMLAGQWVFWAGIVWNLLLGLVMLRACVSMKTLQEAARTIADGDLDFRVDTSKMFLDFKAHGEDLNRIGEGLSLAVEDRLKSERMKTELITNVSHDLKTPLTSIVNYVDLLKKEELTGSAGEYVEVLDRQSARLKKLTEDLVEASKASTGNLHVTLESVDLGEFLDQAQAEYSARLVTAELQSVVEEPTEKLLVSGDGRYLWRIMDNLLGNVCKYALPHTRVYLSARKEGDYGVLSVKNISRERLNISADELMERFVRGDSSRNTEGSGLGLSIAQSLAALMGGRLELTVDGDLFKAEVHLPRVETPAVETPKTEDK